jgi:diguanylate cyclase (GGDEF)-like protein
MHVDLNHFKPISDTWGHAAGDEVLRKANLRMKAALREIDTVAHLGGDEFVIVIENLKDNRDAGIIAKHVLNVLANGFYWQQYEFYIGCSIGISISSNDKEIAEGIGDPKQLESLTKSSVDSYQHYSSCPQWIRKTLNVPSINYLHLKIN